ncbi:MULTISPECIES: exosome complex RNA-binding protein Rrp4 [Fervidicoccus]|jgi:exosome complex component RRP4|nr:exosome complex RNA-binding protein Rrp4 [Fervidicoccus fontis]
MEKPVFYVQQRDIVLPGDLVGEGKIETNSLYIYNIGNKYYSSIIGMVEIKDDKLFFYPKEQIYIPKPNDLVIGLITDVGPTYWDVDLNSPYEGQLPVSETPLRQTHATVDTMRKFLSIGDFVALKVLSFDRLRDPLLTMRGKGLGKIYGGKVIDIAQHAVNSLINRKRALVEAIVKETKTEILISNNGRVWIKGTDSILEDLAVLAIKKLESVDLYSITSSEIINFIQIEKQKRGIGDVAQQ